MIFGARIEYEGPDGNTLVLDSDDGTRTLPISDEALGELDAALNPYRMGLIQMEIVRREREAAGNITLTEYRCPDPETAWFEIAAEAGDLHRKAVRERGSEQFDPGDENDRAA